MKDNIAKLQKKASEKLITFKEKLYKKILTLNLLYWDDTVIIINTKRGCLRFYGNENILIILLIIIKMRIE